MWSSNDKYEQNLLYALFKKDSKRFFSPLPNKNLSKIITSFENHHTVALKNPGGLHISIAT